MRVYKRSDRITVKIGDVIAKLAPMSLHQKTEVQMAMLKGHKSSDLRELTRGLALAIKYSLKGIEGLEDADGNAYKLEFEDEDPTKDLTEACLDDLLNLDMSEKLSLVCAEMVNGIPTKFTSPITKQDLEGVELVKDEKAPTEKKN